MLANLHSSGMKRLINRRWRFITKYHTCKCLDYRVLRPQHTQTFFSSWPLPLTLPPFVWLVWLNLDLTTTTSRAQDLSNWSQASPILTQKCVKEKGGKELTCVSWSKYPRPYIRLVTTQWSGSEKINTGEWNLTSYCSTNYNLHRPRTHCLQKCTQITTAAIFIILLHYDSIYWI
jgi:hypothetical protein